MTKLTKLTERVRKGIFVFLLVILIFLDQCAKKFVHRIFENQNFAFSLPLPVWLMYFIYALVLIGLVVYTKKNYQHLNFLHRLSLTLIFAGAISNVVERIFLGHVRDFIYITYGQLTGIYNLADGYIIAGIVLLLMSKNNKNDKNEQKLHKHS